VFSACFLYDGRESVWQQTFEEKTKPEGRKLADMRCEEVIDCTATFVLYCYTSAAKTTRDVKCVYLAYTWNQKFVIKAVLSGSLRARSRHRVASTGCAAEESYFCFRHGQETFLPNLLQTDPRPTYPLSEHRPRALSHGIGGGGREADHSQPFSTVT